MLKYTCPHCNFIFNIESIEFSGFINVCNCFNKKKYFSSYSTSNNILYISIGYSQNDLIVIDFERCASFLEFKGAKQKFDYILSPEQVFKYFNLNSYL